MLEPNLPNSRTLREELQRANALNEREDPNETKSNMEAAEPTLP
jgi:hypothetical protein